ncbi:hypothetical protein HZS80_08720 [Halomonas glaciei]|uniref:Uncharacterized protein n=2 Tax=Vreelandella TaxID=3137766 RepID=A0A7Z0LSG3_9GAMM|nr:hypothetical protein [Halomonas glaciei]NYS77797.1 hypothetical protein [Halomonas glaciei]|tara:strand:+ start:781 stop:924 length:144 start_codon:yes stop_codon:yes gene_type:complete
MPKFDATSLANDELEAPEEKECDFCGEKPSIEYLGGQALCEDCLEDG